MVGGLARRGNECVRGERRGHWLEEKEVVVVAGSGIACWDEREVGGVAGMVGGWEHLQSERVRVGRVGVLGGLGSVN